MKVGGQGNGKQVTFQWNKNDGMFDAERVLKDKSLQPVFTTSLEAGRLAIHLQSAEMEHSDRCIS